MPLQLTTTTGTQELTSDAALTWLRDAGLRLPEHIDEDGLDLFLGTRDKTYTSTQGREFLRDLGRFLQVRMSIRTALRNLDAYEQHLEAQEVTPDLVRQVLGVKGPTKIDPDLKKHVEDVVNDALDEEWDYIEECRASLYAQLDWHTQGNVDKGGITPQMLLNALSAVTKEELKKDNAKSLAKYRYYEPVRLRLMSLGFVVSPPGTPLGAVFPESDWVRDIPLELMFLARAKAITDDLVQRYRLLGDDSSAVTRLLKPPQDHALSASFKNDWRTVCTAFVSTVGCLCVSWTRHKEGGKTVYVPVLGLSGVVQEEPNETYFRKYCRHLALPAWEKDPEVPVVKAPSYRSDKDIDALRTKLKKQTQELLDLGLMGKNSRAPKDDDEQDQLDAYNRLKGDVELQDFHAKKKHEEFHDREEIKKGLWVNYDAMIRRTNLVALDYRTRTLLQLRRPARQALLSYVSFRENKAHPGMRIEEHPVPELRERALGVDLWICGWHSLNCAEPAALMTASSYFCDGSDVLVCFPYEGFQDTGPHRNRPKETCPWCAAVELGFRSLSRDTGKVDSSKQTGAWPTQFTLSTLNEPSHVLPVNKGFDAFDDTNPITVSTRKTLSGVNSRALVKNSNLDERAYSDVVETKIGRVRSMYHLLGLLDRQVIALDRPLFGRVKGFGASASSGRGRWPRQHKPGGRRPGSGGRGPGGTNASSFKEIEKWSKQAGAQLQDEAQGRAQQAAMRYNADVRRNFDLTDNPGGGDCMYYAFADGVKRRSPQAASQLSEGKRLEESMVYREGAAAMTASLIRRGVGISPVMFRDMRPSQEILRTLERASTLMDRIRLDAWAHVRLRRGLGIDYAFRDTDPNYAQHVAMAEAHVLDAIRRDGRLGAMLGMLADAYENGQRRRRQWAGDLDFRGLVLAFRVNLRMHYVDASVSGIRDRNGHRVDVYNYRELSAQYFGSNVPEAAVTIDVFHVNDNHYVVGHRR